MRICIEGPVTKRTVKQRHIHQNFYYVQIDLSDNGQAKKRIVTEAIFQYFSPESEKICVWFTNVKGSIPFGEDKSSECLGECVRLFSNIKELIESILNIDYESIACIFSVDIPSTIDSIRRQIKNESSIFRFHQKSRLEFILSKDSRDVSLVLIDQGADSIEAFSLKPGIIELPSIVFQRISTITHASNTQQPLFLRRE